MYIIHTSYIYAMYGCPLGMHSMFVPTFVVITEVVCVGYYIYALYICIQHMQKMYIVGWTWMTAKRLKGRRILNVAPPGSSL